MEAKNTGAAKADGILTQAFDYLHNGSPDIMHRVKDKAHEITISYSRALYDAVFAYDIEKVEKLTYTYFYGHVVIENSGFVKMLGQELSMNGWDFVYSTKENIIRIRPNKSIRSQYWRRSFKQKIMKIFAKKK